MGRFVERWAHAEDMNIKLGAALMSLILVCLVLTAALVFMALKPRPIYYVPGVAEAGMALPQSIPQMTVVSFVSSWVLNWSNFTPATVNDVYARAKRFMSPHLLAQTQVRLDKDIAEVKNNNISSLFSITQEPVVSKVTQGFNVSVQGDKGIFMGKEEIKTQRMTYQVSVRTINPTENNPYGLMIEAIDQEVGNL